MIRRWRRDAGRWGCGWWLGNDERAKARMAWWPAKPSKYPGVGPWMWRWFAYVVEQRTLGWRDGEASALFAGD